MTNERDVRRMYFPSIEMNNGDIFDGGKIAELVEAIIEKFSDEGLSHDEAKIVLDRVGGVIGEYSKVQKVN